MQDFKAKEDGILFCLAGSIRDDQIEATTNWDDKLNKTLRLKISRNMHRNSLREKYEKKRKERQDILGTGGLSEATEDKKLLSITEGEKISMFLDHQMKLSFFQNSRCWHREIPHQNPFRQASCSSNKFETDRWRNLGADVTENRWNSQDSSASGENCAAKHHWAEECVD